MLWELLDQLNCVVMENSSGRPESEKSNSTIGVVSIEPGFGGDLGEMGHSSSGSLCHAQKFQIGRICVPISSPKSLASQCLQFLLDRSVPLRVSPLGYSGGGPAETEGRSCSDDTDRSYMANQAMVPLIATDEHGRTNTASTMGGLVETAPIGGGARQSSGSTASGLEIVRQSLTSRGFSQQVS